MTTEIVLSLLAIVILVGTIITFFFYKDITNYMSEDEKEMKKFEKKFIKYIEECQENDEKKADNESNKSEKKQKDN